MLKLRYLTSDEKWIAIASRYWQYDPVQKRFPVLVEELAEALSTNIRQVSLLLERYCQAYDDEYICSRCGEPATIFLSRSDYTNFRRVPKGNFYARQKKEAPLCDACRHLKEEEQRAEAESQKRLDESKKLEILSGYQFKRPSVNINDLTLEQALFLNAYGRAGLSENFALLRSIATLQKMNRKLAPMEENEREIVNSLFNAKLISIHPRNSPNILTNVRTNEDFEIDIKATNWYFPLSISDSESPASLYLEIEQSFRDRQWLVSWQKQVLSLWLKMAVWECLEYLNYAMLEHSLPFQPGLMTIQTISSLLKNFSTGQIWNFIWRAVQDAAAFYMRGNGSKRHAANTVPGSIRRLAEHAMAENWKVRTFHRNFNCRQSVVSQVLFDVVLKVGDAGFSSVPYEIQG